MGDVEGIFSNKIKELWSDWEVLHKQYTSLQMQERSIAWKIQRTQEMMQFISDEARELERITMNLADRLNILLLPSKSSQNLKGNTDENL